MEDDRNRPLKILLLLKSLFVESTDESLLHIALTIAQLLFQGPHGYQHLLIPITSYNFYYCLGIIKFRNEESILVSDLVVALKSLEMNLAQARTSPVDQEGSESLLSLLSDVISLLTDEEKKKQWMESEEESKKRGDLGMTSGQVARALDSALVELKRKHPPISLKSIFSFS